MPNTFETTYNKAYTFEEYVQLMQDLVAQGKTTGPNQSESMTHYTKMNWSRMQRWMKTIDMGGKVVPSISGVVWLIATEAWCGDAAHNIPYIQKFAEQAGVETRYFLRDSEPKTMDLMRTDGSLSIPKVAMLKFPTFELVAQWGPRPKVAHEMVLDFKENPNGRVYQDLVLELQKWYNQNKNQDLHDELLQFAEKAENFQSI